MGTEDMNNKAAKQAPVNNESESFNLGMSLLKMLGHLILWAVSVVALWFMIKLAISLIGGPPAQVSPIPYNYSNTIITPSATPPVASSIEPSKN